MRVTWLALEWPRDGEHTGGVGRYVHRLAVKMAGLVELTVVAIEGAIPVDGVKIVTLPRPGGRFDRFYRTPVVARTVVARTWPDVVHAHGDDWALRGGVPVVRSFYGTSWGEARSSSGLRKINHAVLAATEHVSAHRAALKVAIAPESFDAFHCDHLVPPLVGLADPLPRNPSPTPSVLFIGSYGGRKRGWLAEQAVAQASEMLGRTVQLVVVGPAADARNWGPGVRHLDGLTDADVAVQLSETWLLVAPSKYEGFGIPTVEALHAGVPVVASPNPGSRWIANQGQAQEPVPLVLQPDDGALGHDVAAAVRAGPVMPRGSARATEDLIGRLLSAASAAIFVERYAAVIRSR